MKAQADVPPGGKSSKQGSAVPEPLTANNWPFSKTIDDPQIKAWRVIDPLIGRLNSERSNLEILPPGQAVTNETAQQRSARRRKILDPLLKVAGITSPEVWAAQAGGNMDKNTPRDYLKGKTRRLRRGSREALAKPLNKTASDLPD